MIRLWHSSISISLEVISERECLSCETDSRTNLCECASGVERKQILCIVSDELEGPERRLSFNVPDTL